jgi:hypothetical protein
LLGVKYFYPESLLSQETALKRPRLSERKDRMNLERFSFSSTRMLFIVSSNLEKVDSATRKLIRSHVMRGKKREKGHPDKDHRTMSQATMTGRIQVAPVSLEEVIQTYAPLVPGRVGSDLSFVEFADEVEPSMLLKMTKC